MQHEFGKPTSTPYIKCIYVSRSTKKRKNNGGEGGIRTHGRVSPTHAFQACSLNRSDTSPHRVTLFQFSRKRYDAHIAPDSLGLCTSSGLWYTSIIGSGIV